MAGLCERPSKAVSLPAVDDAVEKTLEGPQNGLEQGREQGQLSFTLTTPWERRLFDKLLHNTCTSCSNWIIHTVKKMEI